MIHARGRRWVGRTRQGCRFGSPEPGADPAPPSGEPFSYRARPGQAALHADPARFEALSAEQRTDLDRRSIAYDRELTEKGHYVISEAIQNPGTAVLVRSRNGAISNTDGPYMETKEFMAGFILVEARDMNEAVRLAAGIPMAEMGTIEVRPVYLIPTPPEKA